MTSGRRLTPKQKERVKKLLADGLKPAQVAKRMQISVSAVYAAR